MSNRRMNIDWNHFTPWMSLAGGLLVGLAAALLLLLHGRVLGISGIVGGLLRGKGGEAAWQLPFLIGLLAAPLLWGLLVSPVVARIDTGPAVLVVAGLLVGYGTRRGSGCTSGHGVCGISRLSPRSLVATGLFMLTGFATVAIVRHVLA
jgi:uncharacterized membrane protein YedE/YeeE